MTKERETPGSKRAANKAHRMQLRVTASQRELFASAAAAGSQTLSAFMLEAAEVSARNRLADRSRFELGASDFDAFMQALERPARVDPKLGAWLRRPSVLERDVDALSSRASDE